MKMNMPYSTNSEKHDQKKVDGQTKEIKHGRRYRPETETGTRDMRCHPMDLENTKARAVLGKITSDKYKSLALQHMVSVAVIATG